jgi:glycosyltransferase involved in cell wall biosynthesis
MRISINQFQDMKKKVLIIQNIIPHYRKALYNLLSNEYNLTIAHSGVATVSVYDLYKEVVLPVKKIGSLNFQVGLLKEMNKEYDVIISMCDFHWPLNFFPLIRYSKSPKFILWGSWLTDKPIIDWLKIYCARKADANIFYCIQDKEKFLRANVSVRKLFVANNTIDVGDRSKSYLHPRKFRIIFVGTLDERKENDILIKAFNNINNKISPYINLTIIGEGPTKKDLIILVKQLNVSERICFEGKITDPKKLSKFYSESIVSVSYGQAGLSVLQCLGFGVPFITKINAISGGEKTNIIDGFNGFFCDGSQADLERKLLLLCKDLERAKNMGENAFEYYSNYCTIEKMANGFIDAIK